MNDIEKLDNVTWYGHCVINIMAAISNLPDEAKRALEVLSAETAAIHAVVPGADCRGAAPLRSCSRWRQPSATRPSRAKA
jgi:hypothetical protein